jgi:hypothetical protein
MSILKLHNRNRGNEGQPNGHISVCGLYEMKADFLIRKIKQYISEIILKQMRSADLFTSVLKDNGVKQIRKKNTKSVSSRTVSFERMHRKCEGNYYRETQNETETTM